MDTKFSRADVANDFVSGGRGGSKSFSGSLDVSVKSFNVLSSDFNVSSVGLLLRS